MTPISELTNAELDELIFKLQGWVKLQPPAYPKWQHPGIDGTKLWFEDYIPSPTTDPRYAMELLKEMATDKNLQWVALEYQPSILKWKLDMLRIPDYQILSYADTPERAIAEAYAQWKGAK